MDAWIGLFGVLVGTALTLLSNFFINERQRRHELVRLEIEKQNERKQFLRERYEELVSTVYEINNLIIGKLNTYDDSHQNFLSNDYHQMGVKVQTLICTYFHGLDDVVSEFVLMAHEVNDAILTSNTTEIEEKIDKLDTVREKVLKELKNYAEIYT